MSPYAICSSRLNLLRFTKILRDNNGIPKGNGCSEKLQTGRFPKADFLLTPVQIRVQLIKDIVSVHVLFDKTNMKSSYNAEKAACLEI